MMVKVDGALYKRDPNMEILNMGDRVALTCFWEKYAQSPSLETMMLNKNAADFDELDRNDVISTLPDLSRMRVIDVGSGIGRFTVPLAAKARHVLATDFMKPFVDKNRELHSHLGNVEFLCAPATKLDLDAESYEFVFTNWLLMYLTDGELVEFLSKVLVWLTPNGWFHFRESCSESSKRASDKPDENPTHYRHISQYLSLIEKLRVKDERSGRIVRFEVTWTKSIDIYIQAVGNWRQVHTLMRKVWADHDENSGPHYHRDFIHDVSVAPLREKERLVKSMAMRKALWNARSPFESLFMKFLKDKLNLTCENGVLNLCFDPSAAVSSFCVAEEFGCPVVNLDTNIYLYDYNLAMANAADDKRLRFQWIADANQQDWRLPKRCFDLVIACHLSSHVKNFEKALRNIQSSMALGGKVILLEKCRGSKQILDHAKHNGFSSTVNLDDVSVEVRMTLKEAIADIGDTPELQPLRQKYESWLAAGDSSMKWHLLTASHGF